MIRKPFFSVVIPTLNEENYLPKILLDFSRQRKKNFEVIIVDAKSDDTTKDKATSFSRQFPLKFIDSQKRNVACQRNLGAKHAKGKFLIFLDADTRVSTVFTSNLHSDILQIKGSLFLPILAADDPTRKNKILFNLINYVVELSQSLNKPFSAGGCMMIEKKVFNDLNGFKENLYISEDHNLVQRARKIGVKAKVLKDIKVVFSLRRIKKEGQVLVLYKYLLASIYTLINGEVKDKIFMYEMGGGRYKDQLKEKWNFREDTILIRKLLKKTSSFLSN